MHRALPDSPVYSTRSLSGMPSRVIVLGILQPRRASRRCPARLRVHMRSPRIVWHRNIVFSTRLRWLYPDAMCHSRRPSLSIERMFPQYTPNDEERCVCIDPPSIGYENCEDAVTVLDATIVETCDA